MTIYDFKDYKTFLRKLIAEFPKKGRGQSRRLAEHIGVAPIVVSQILARDRQFTADQAVLVAEFFGLDERATEYFVLLVSQGRADTKKLREFYQRKLDRVRSEAQNIKNLVQGREELSDADKGRFYSNWYYCGVWLLTSVPGFQSVEAIADRLGLKRAKVGEIVSFLLETGLCTEKSGKIWMDTKSTHVDDKSEFVNNHRRNWREKAREKFTQPAEGDFFYSSPVSLSEKDAEKFRAELLRIIKDFSKQVADSPAEKLMCFNIDWFEY